MTLEEIQSAINEYPAANVKLTVVDWKPEKGQHLSTGENASFKIEVSNSGILSMKNVTLRIECSEYIWAADSLGNPTKNPVIISKPEGIDAGQIKKFRFTFHVQGKKGTPGNDKAEIFKVGIESFDADLTPILQTGPPRPQTLLSTFAKPSTSMAPRWFSSTTVGPSSMKSMLIYC